MHLSCSHMCNGLWWIISFALFCCVHQEGLTESGESCCQFTNNSTAKLFIGTVTTCNVSSMVCRNCTCFCERGYDFDVLTDSCVPRKQIPGENCTEDGDCVDGLKCKEDSCTCPSGCEYNREFGVCDCGDVAVGIPLEVVVIGVVLSLLSVVIWVFCVIQTVNRRSNSNESLHQRPDMSTTLTPVNHIATHSFPMGTKDELDYKESSPKHGVSPLLQPTRLSPVPLEFRPISYSRLKTPNPYERVKNTLSRSNSIILPLEPMLPSYPALFVSPFVAQHFTEGNEEEPTNREEN